MVDEVLPGGVRGAPLAGGVGAREVVLAVGVWEVGALMVGLVFPLRLLLEFVRLEPKAPKPLNREFIKAVRRRSETYMGRRTSERAKRTRRQE